MHACTSLSVWAGNYSASALSAYFMTSAKLMASSMPGIAAATSCSIERAPSAPPAARTQTHTERERETERKRGSDGGRGNEGRQGCVQHMRVPRWPNDPSVRIVCARVQIYICPRVSRLALDVYAIHFLSLSFSLSLSVGVRGREASLYANARTVCLYVGGRGCSAPCGSFKSSGISMDGSTSYEWGRQAVSTASLLPMAPADDCAHR
jgi:hypothetical protein